MLDDFEPKINHLIGHYIDEPIHIGHYIDESIHDQIQTMSIYILNSVYSIQTKSFDHLII